MKPLRFFVLSMCFIGLSACQTWDGMVKDFESIELPALNNATTRSAENLVYSGDCPAVDAVEELQSLSEFTDINNQSDDNLVAKVDITNLQSACSYDERSVTIDVRTDFVGTLGTQGRAPASFSYPFFVAITSAGGEILAKEVFAAQVNYDAGQTTYSYTEKLRQIIPIETKARGSHYKVLVGFQLTPDQLAYNRKMIAERIAAEKAQKEAEEKLLREAEEQKKTAFESGAQTAQEQAAKDTIYIGRPVTITP
ncbi:MAG: hypothetical protein H6861_06370 [Rhodospirillales bacterium]|nr:hypothetical protein [Rhodospirillales bacterium]